MATPGPCDVSWRRMNLTPSWQAAHRELSYIHEPFNNHIDVERWQSLGFSQTRFTGDMYDMRFAEPRWMASVREVLPMKNFAWSVYRMRPGDILPEHSDIYLRYRQIYNLTNTDIIRRYIIFLEDWQSGHYFEIDGTPLVRWQAGEGLYWHGDTPHIAANLGTTARYTLQITGTL